jgi:trk system potassium uptake protein TrkH
VIGWFCIGRVLGFFILGLTGFLCIPMGLALIDRGGGLIPFAYTLLAAVITGGSLTMLCRQEPHEINRREGILFVVLAWISAVTIGALPFWFSEYVPSFTDAFFETMSGFTTTGATIMTDIEGLPRSLLLWRALTHWLGGMGIIVLGIAILPLLGTGGMELYRSEFSGARSEKLKPRIAETAMSLWKIYVSLTVAQYIALRFAGMNEFDAVCHAFATMATGGFSTRAISIEAYQSPLIEYIIIFFMIAAGINFTRHYRLLVQRRPREFYRDPEIQAFGFVILAATLVIMISLFSQSSSSEEKFRQSLFQVVSIVTTTGFSSTDFELWSPFATFVLLVLMFIGGCTGSTAGGMKVSRIVMLLKVVGREFRRMSERRGIFAVRFGGRAVSENTISSLLNLVYLAFIINFAACLFLTAMGIDLITAFSAVAASMFNIGPGLGLVGPADNYAHLPTAVKWVLSLCMLAGRLEFYTVFVIFTPMFWRK